MRIRGKKKRSLATDKIPYMILKSEQKDPIIPRVHAHFNVNVVSNISMLR